MNDSKFKCLELPSAELPSLSRVSQSTADFDRSKSNNVAEAAIFAKGENQKSLRQSVKPKNDVPAG